MAVTRIQNNQITDASINAAGKVATGTITGNLFAPSVTLNSNVTITGNLTVSGNITTLSATETYVNDPLVIFNNGYTGSLSGYDIGLLLNRNLTSLASYGSVNTAWVWVENDGAFEGIATTATGQYGSSLQNINNSGWANLKIGNTTVSGTLIATAVNSPTIGNTSANIVGTGTYITGLSGVNVSGTVPTANVSLYQQLTNNATNATFYLPFLDKATGNAASYTNTTVNVNPSTGNVYATAFVGSGLYLTNLPGSASSNTANVAYYEQVTNTTTNASYFPILSTQSATGNTAAGVNSSLTYNPSTANLTIGQLAITSNAISSLNSTQLNIGPISSLSITGGSNGYALTTNGTGTLAFNPANVIVLGANASGSLVSNALTLTVTTSTTDAIAQLNQILGKLTPSSPPNFPGNVATSIIPASTFTITTGTTSAIMTGDSARGTGWTQQNQISGNTYQLAGGTTFSAIRSNAYATSTLSAIKSGTGNVRAWIGGNVVAGFVNITGASGTTTNGNLTITNDTDFHNVALGVAAGFWQSANVSAATAAGIAPGWNTITIEDLGGYTTGNTNSLMWYNDISSAAAGTPTFSNTSATLTTNVVTYSSSIPHFTSGSIFRLKGNVNNLSGETYPTTSNTAFTSAQGAAGGFQAPTAVATGTALASAGYWSGTLPLPRYLCNTTYGSGTSAYYETNSSILTTGFGNSTAGPTLTVTNGYTASAATAHSPSATILWKNGTGTAIDETTIAATTPIGAVSGGMYRVVYAQSTDTGSAVTGSETTWNSTSSTLATYDATVTGWASPTSGVIRCDQTNYSTGYLPVGPNLTGQGSTQYFTVRFAQSGVSTFYLNYTGICANIFCAMPTSGGVGGTNATSVSNATYNGWLTAAISNSGGVPGPGSSGNGSAGCVTGAVPSFNTVVTSGTGSGKMQIYFGTTLSTGAVGNYIYIRFKLTAGQYISALSLTAT